MKSGVKVIVVAALGILLLVIILSGAGFVEKHPWLAVLFALFVAVSVTIFKSQKSNR